MSSTGMVRKVDALGRIVMPAELRRKLALEEKAPLEFFVDEDRIILKKYEPACIFCGDAEDIMQYEHRNICKKCAGKIGAL